MPLPPTAKFTNSKQPESLIYLDARGFGQVDRTYNKDPKRDAAVRAKKMEILALLDDFPTEPLLIPVWVEQCMHLGYLGGAGLTRNPRTDLAYIAVRTEVLNYDEDSCSRRAVSGYPDFFLLRARRGFTQTLRVPFDEDAFNTTFYSSTGKLLGDGAEEKDKKRRAEAGHLSEEYLQLLEMAKVALAFGQDDKAHTMLSYSFRRMEAWAKAN